ncbi:MAG: hypothetical protein KDE34_29020, partial [Anaerolineales bacterium]|nr:hypothetical protein [Anaerolineales bacterium]
SPTSGLVNAATSTPPVPTANPQAPFRLSASPVVPGHLQAELQDFAAANGDLFRWVDEGDAEVRLEVGATTPAAAWVYTVVAPFATLQDEISLVEVQSLWAAGQIAIPAAELPLWQAVWGVPTTGPVTAPAGKRHNFASTAVAAIASASRA